MIVWCDIVDPEHPAIASDAFPQKESEYDGVLTFGPCKQQYYDIDDNMVSADRYKDMSAEEKGDCEKKFDFVVSNKLQQIDMEGQSKKQQKKALKLAFVNYLKASMTAKCGEGKSPEKKAFKTKLSADGGLLGKNGFIVSKILADPTEFDYFHAVEKYGAIAGESAIIVCEWVGSDAVFHILADACEQKKY